MTGALLLWYDDFHTPLDLIGQAVDVVAVLHVDLGGTVRPEPPAHPRLRVVDARERFCEEYVLPAVRAHACYQGGYRLSAALSRPLLAETCAQEVALEGLGVVVHGLAGNDQLRFEMAVQALVPQVTVTPVASVLGSQNVRNADGYTVSDNLWGHSTEAGPLRDPGAVPPAQAFTRWLPPHATPVPAEMHTVAFEAGRPVGIDGESLGLLALIERLDGIGRTFGVGYADSVEDGFVGLKSRAVYEAPAAAALIVAHRDLERFVSTRRQNDFKAVVDKAWTDLVYDGYWFDPQRRSLEAYIRTLDEWATGEVDLLFRSGGVQPVARRSPYGLYDEREAIYRVGQDFAARSSTATAASLSAHMRAAVRRPGSVPTEEAVPAWNA